MNRRGFETPRAHEMRQDENRIKKWASIIVYYLCHLTRAWDLKPMSLQLKLYCPLRKTTSPFAYILSIHVDFMFIMYLQCNYVFTYELSFCRVTIFLQSNYIFVEELYFYRELLFWRVFLFLFLQMNCVVTLQPCFTFQLFLTFQLFFYTFF